MRRSFGSVDVHSEGTASRTALLNVGSGVEEHPDDPKHAHREDDDSAEEDDVYEQSIGHILFVPPCFLNLFFAFLVIDCIRTLFNWSSVPNEHERRFDRWRNRPGPAPL